MLQFLIAIAVFSCVAYLVRLDRACLLSLAVLFAGTLSLTASAQSDSGSAVAAAGEGLPIADGQQEDAGMLVETLIKAVHNKWYGMAGAALLSLLIFALRLMKPDLPPKYVKLAMALLVTLPPIVVALKKPGVTPDNLIATSITSVLMAVGLWKMALQDSGLGTLLEKRIAAVAASSIASPAPVVPETPTENSSPKS